MLFRCSRRVLSLQLCRTLIEIPAKKVIRIEMSTLPSLPQSILTDYGHALKAAIAKDVEDIQQEQSGADDVRDAIFRQSKNVFKTNAAILFAVRTGEVSSLESLVSENISSIALILASTNSDPMQREGRLSSAIEKFTEARLLYSFFTAGKLASPANVQPCNDEEYIGAILGFAQELSRYVVGRASEGDRASIVICRKLIIQLNSKMLEFDFRNGPLRKKYDGLKYALKTIEDVMYEMSLLDDDATISAAAAAAATESASSSSASSKRRRIEDGVAVMAVTTDGGAGAGAGAGVEEKAEEVATVEEEEASLLDDAAIDAIRTRMDAYDKMREEVIKQSRDVQKLSKQAVFSVHRGQLGDARNKLNQAEKLATNIFKIVNEQPSLRQGSFSNSLEEWAEGALTVEWAEKQRIATKADLKFVNSNEYIGALSDFTGEIGRLAVASASKRDVEAVRNVLQADVTIAGALVGLNSSGKYTRKTDAVLQNLKKVEDIVYELSLLKKGGRVKEREPEPKDTARDADDKDN